MSLNRIRAASFNEQHKSISSPPSTPKNITPETETTQTNTPSIQPSGSIFNTLTQSSQCISINPGTQLPIKLSGSSNYLTWRAQIELLLLGYDLLPYIEGTLLYPPLKNLQYHSWRRQDGLIRHVIMASVDATIAPLVATSKNSLKAWTRLETSYANKSQSCVYSLRETLNQISKGTNSIAQYLNVIRFIADELAISGHPMRLEELVMKTLIGLGPEYDPISAAIQMRDSFISFEELHNKFSSHEIFLRHSKQSSG
ncbi:Retrovirus-related pol polyprotein from transposon tnt 1-94 [Quillaja saponaria]|uniref:Retrovirus-related pol polyprotein from transposon tnt 1-94 n=1 Tax=Quillaja saponaria TaxID=32244 RepID=A0AAD7L4N1_QUISA|nr:Retrovirus-related pol polyprotein from transposon tnt 1-94 [Quillaja saponaria]